MPEPLNVRRRVEVLRSSSHAHGVPHPARHPPGAPAQEERVRIDRLNDLKEVNFALRACEWENARSKQDPAIARLYATKKIDQEMMQGAKELLCLRRARLKEFLEMEAVMCAAIPAQRAAACWCRAARCRTAQVRGEAQLHGTCIGEDTPVTRLPAECSRAAPRAAPQGSTARRSSRLFDGIV